MENLQPNVQRPIRTCWTKSIRENGGTLNPVTDDTRVAQQLPIAPCNVMRDTGENPVQPSMPDKPFLGLAHWLIMEAYDILSKTMELNSSIARLRFDQFSPCFHREENRVKESERKCTVSWSHQKYSPQKLSKDSIKYTGLQVLIRQLKG